MSWFSRRRREEDLDREINAHLELEAEEQRASGLPDEASHFAARRSFGNVAYIKEEVRLMWGWTQCEAMLQDMRFAVRALRKHPGFALSAILTLALGIGASTAVFTVVNSVLLKPLSYPESNRLVVIWEHVKSIGGGPVGPNPRHAELWARRSDALAGITAYQSGRAAVALGSEGSSMLGSVLCQPNLFRILKVSPVLGRDFLPDEGQSGGPKVTILTFAAWQSLFQGDRSVIGRVIRVNDVPTEVIGVLPEDFGFPNANAIRPFSGTQPKSGIPEPSMFFPNRINFDKFPWNGNYGNWVLLARLGPGVSITSAAAQLNSIQDQLWREMPSGSDTSPGAFRASLQPMHEAVVSESSAAIWLLMAAVAGLTLIACLNLANSQLGRALTLRRDASVRAALGAARWRLMWSALAESLILAFIGGALGVLLANVGLSAFRRYSPIDIPRLAEVRLDLPMLLFSAVVTIAASLIFGLLPAMRLLATDPQASLQHSAGGRSISGSRAGRRLRLGLIGVQVFGCTALLLVTGLFSKSLLHLLNQDKGFDTSNSAIAEVRLTPQYYNDSARRVSFIDGVLQSLRTIPGVESAGFFSAMPLEGDSWIEFTGRADRANEKGPMVNARWASPGYFEATGQKLIAGRFFEDRDRSLDNVILSEGVSKALWGSSDPIGGRLNALGKTLTVIGVVGDSRSTSLKAEPTRMIYVHYNFRTPSQIYFVARSHYGADSMVSSMREAIAKQAPSITITRLKTMDAQLTDSLSRERFQTFVLLAFGASALFLAMLGVYGVLSYSVAARKHEIGVRMALGATKRSVYRLALAEAAGPVLAGLVAGLAVSSGASRIVEKFLFGTQALDPAVILMVIGLIVTSAVTAAFLPARRAASIDPMEALRLE
jgi:predicted permease